MARTDYVSDAEAASLMGLHRGHVQRLCRQGRLRARKDGRAWRISRKAIDQYRGSDQHLGVIDAAALACRDLDDRLAHGDGPDLEATVRGVRLLDEALRPLVARVAALQGSPDAPRLWRLIAALREIPGTPVGST